MDVADFTVNALNTVFNAEILPAVGHRERLRYPFAVIGMDDFQVLLPGNQHFFGPDTSDLGRYIGNLYRTIQFTVVDNMTDARDTLGECKDGFALLQLSLGTPERCYIEKGSDGSGQIPVLAAHDLTHFTHMA